MRSIKNLIHHTAGRTGSPEDEAVKCARGDRPRAFHLSNGGDHRAELLLSMDNLSFFIIYQFAKM